LGAGDLSSPLTRSVIARPAVGIVTFKAGNNRCRGIICVPVRVRLSILLE
jgi:hypothetical protein